MDVMLSLLSGAVALAVPLLLAALGEIVMERSGVLNIALEGLMLVAAFFAMYGTYTTGSLVAGTLAGMAGAVAMSALFGGLCVGARADQVVIGAGLNILALGLTGVLLRAAFGLTGEPLQTRAFSPIALPLLSDIPVLGKAFFEQSALVYVAYLLVPLTWFFLERTRYGLALRAAGENPDAVAAAGLRLTRIRMAAVLAGGMFCGLAGAYLSLGQANTFVEGMTAGRGFIALAIVIFARWQPGWAAAVALLFGLASALQFQFQAIGLEVPYQFFLMLPYILTLLAAAFFGTGKQAPAALAKAYLNRR